METQELREKLHQFIESVEDKKVEAMYALFEDQISINDDNFLTSEQVKILDEERKMHLNNTSASYTWEEAQEIIRDGNRRP